MIDVTQRILRLYSGSPEWDFVVTNISFIYRSLPQPLMTYDLHYKFIHAASKPFLEVSVFHKYSLISGFFPIEEIKVNNIRYRFINPAECICPILVIMSFHFKWDKKD